MATSLGKPVTRELPEDVIAQELSLSQARPMVIKLTTHGLFFLPKGRHGGKCEQFVPWKEIFRRGNAGTGWDQLRRDAKP
jgi:hypothetical protein